MEIRDVPELNELLDLFRQRGYPPVVVPFEDEGSWEFEDEGSWEIEARLDANRLLIMTVWPSGTADAWLETKEEGAPNGATTVGQILAWVKALYSEGGDGL